MADGAPLAPVRDSAHLAPVRDNAHLALVRELFEQVRRRGFAVGPSELDALRRALAAGFGWASREAFGALLEALWAKSLEETRVLRALLAQQPWPEDWTAAADERPLPPPAGAQAVPLAPPVVPTGGAAAGATGTQAARARRARVREQAVGSLPTLTLDGVALVDERLMLIEQYPLSAREVAQTFRRLRKPQRFGPPTELDVAATLERRSRSPVAAAPVLVPRRRNTLRLALWIDVQGSMAPFAGLVQAFGDAVLGAGLLHQTRRLYFHDLPTRRVDRRALAGLDDDELFPALDPVLDRIVPATDGAVFLDPALERRVRLADVLRELVPGTLSLVVSDAGAARGVADLQRLHDALAFVKALRQAGPAVAWLNPVPRPLWAHGVAAQLARHVPMEPMDRGGIQRVVSALRGHPAPLERPL